MTDLTPPQAKTLAYIKAHIQVNQNFPTMAQISANFGWGSRNAAAMVIKALCRKGFVRKLESCNKWALVKS